MNHLVFNEYLYYPKKLFFFLYAIVFIFFTFLQVNTQCDDSFIKIALSQRMIFISNLLTFGLAIITNMLPRFLPPIFRINSIWIWKIKYPINIKPAIYFTEIFASLEFGLIDWVNRLIAIFYLGFRGEIAIMISTNYHTALITIWQIFYQFLMFSNLFQKNS